MATNVPPFAGTLADFLAKRASQVSISTSTSASTGTPLTAKGILDSMKETSAELDRMATARAKAVDQVLGRNPGDYTVILPDGSRLQGPLPNILLTLLTKIDPLAWPSTSFPSTEEEGEAKP